MGGGATSEPWYRRSRSMKLCYAKRNLVLKQNDYYGGGLYLGYPCISFLQSFGWNSSGKNSTQAAHVITLVDQQDYAKNSSFA